MAEKYFQSKVEQIHKKWLSDVLSMPDHNNGGIDLCDNQTGIELKCRYNFWGSNFAVHAYQIEQFLEENPGKELFWAFLLYNLTQKPVDIEEKDIGPFVSNREVWFFKWDWIRQFPVSYPKTGPYVYIHGKMDFPPEEDFSKFIEKDGTLYVPPGSILEDKLTVPF